MKIGVLTSSRADFGIYLPLLKLLQADSLFKLEIIVFGTHLLERYDNTVNQIIEEGFEINKIPDTMPEADNPSAIAASMGKTTEAFALFLKNNYYDLIFSLGDRYEMFSAVAAIAPFNIPVAHIHGGETTLGAIDNGFRNSITCLSKYNFTSTRIYQKRVVEIIGTNEHVYNVGALSIDNLKNLQLLDIKEFREKYKIDLSRSTILFAFHPETINYKMNEIYIDELISVLHQLKDYQVIITMPNADTMGLMIREKFTNFSEKKKNIIIIENFGPIGYLSAMKHCSFMMGNSSSGFVEASFFPKWVINLGDRQKGRIITNNIIECPINSNKILKAVEKVKSSPLTGEFNIYGNGTAAEKIVSIIKKHI